jgi:(S)-sulfolactate dehydrogenase
VPEIVISEFMDAEAVRVGLAGRDVFYDPKLVDDPARLLALVGEARALVVRNRTEVRGALLAAAPRLLAVGRLGVGLDNIDMHACKARGIAVFPATGANDLAVAEYAVTAVLVLLRSAYFATSRVTAGSWPRNDLIGREAAGKTLGLVGFGAIARETARRACALGLNVIAYDPFVAANDPAWQAHSVACVDALRPLLAASDAVSLHVPLTEATRNLIDIDALAHMRKGAVLVNAARGGIVDEKALAGALRAGHLAGAALDVFAEEPLSAAGGGVFRDVPNLILTPHIAGVTQESNVRVSWVTVENIKRALDAADAGR